MLCFPPPAISASATKALLTKRSVCALAFDCSSSPLQENRLCRLKTWRMPPGTNTFKEVSGKFSLSVQSDGRVWFIYMFINISFWQVTRSVPSHARIPAPKAQGEYNHVSTSILANGNRKGGSPWRLRVTWGLLRLLRRLWLHTENFKRKK